MNGILTQYMMRTILSATALVLVVLLALAGLFEFIAVLFSGSARWPPTVRSW